MMKEHLLPDTIKKSLNYAVEIIQAQGMEYYKFLGVLSLFPGGVSAEDLNLLFPKSSLEDIEDKIQILIDFSAAKKRVENGRTRYSVNRLLANKSKEALKLEEVNQFNWKISKIWINKLKKLFYNFSSLNDRVSRAATKAFFIIERNVSSNLRNILEVAKFSEENKFRSKSKKGGKSSKRKVDKSPTFNNFNQVDYDINGRKITKKQKKFPLSKKKLVSPQNASLKVPKQSKYGQNVEFSFNEAEEGLSNS